MLGRLQGKFQSRCSQKARLLRRMQRQIQEFDWFPVLEFLLDKSRQGIRVQGSQKAMKMFIYIFAILTTAIINKIQIY